MVLASTYFQFHCLAFSSDLTCPINFYCKSGKHYCCNEKLKTYSAGNYMFKVNNRNTRTRCEICSKLTIKTPERWQWRRSGVFIVNFEHISHLALVFLC